MYDNGNKLISSRYENKCFKTNNESKREIFRRFGEEVQHKRL